MRKVLYFVISLSILLCGAMPCTVFAVEENPAKVYESDIFLNDGTVQHSDAVLYEGSFNDAVEYLNYSRFGGGIVLCKDIQLSRGITLQPVIGNPSYILIEGDVTLDLNGQFITQLAGSNFSDKPAIIVPKDSTLTITDTSKSEKGVINGVQYAVGIWGGKLVLDKGIVKAQSPASVAPDYYEQPVQVINGGSITMNGGLILYSGVLDDGRQYLENSCAVYADDTGVVTINGGTIDGKIHIENDENLYINGGTFGFDVSALLSNAYKVSEKKGMYTVEKILPVVTGEANSKSVDVTVKADCNDIGATVTKYTISVVSNVGDIKQLKLEISDVIKSAYEFGFDNIPEVELVTDFASVTLDENDIRAMYGNSFNKKTYFVIEKNLLLADEIYEKLSGAKYGISAKLVDESGAIVSKNTKPDLKITHYATNESVQLYSISGSSMLSKTMVLEADGILCEISNDESLVVSEGTALMITGRTLDLQGTISMIFYASLDGVSSSDAKMLFWEDEQTEYTEATADRIVSYSGKDSNGYRFKYENISSKDMSKKIYARLMAKDMYGNIVYSKVPDSGYSVVSYAENMMKNQKLKPLLVKMLNYGTAAQEYFTTEYMLANSILTEAERVVDLTKVYRSQASTITEDTANGKCKSHIAGKTLILEGDISINYYVLSDEKVDEVGILFWNEDVYEATNAHVVGTQSRAARTYTSNGRYKVFSYDNIVSRQMFEPIYARVYTRTGNVYKYGDIDKYSVKDYAANQIEKNDDRGLVKLLRCLLLYGDEAEKYFRLNR